MPTATITSKGQITIPKHVRDAMSVDSGDRVSFLVRDDGVVEMRPETVDLADLYGVLRRRGRKSVSVQQMNDDIATAAAGAPPRRNRR